MFLIRQARPDDVESLQRLARMVHFINLPADKDVLAEKIRWSRESFRAARHGEAARDVSSVEGLKRLGGAAGSSPQFMFVIEDPQTGSPLGASAIIAQMGTPGHPNLSLRLRRREFFSRDLQTGATHVTAQLEFDEAGPTEIGALIVAPSYRGHAEKLGKQLSLIRFHYIGLHRERFQERLLAEMMAPISTDGRNTFWEYFGRRFINLTYDEADRFCHKSREFMTSLLPHEEIYLTLLPAEARSLVGRVGEETLPARRMLESLGFKYEDRVDPFDAGPHLEAKTDEVSLVRDTREAEIAGECDQAEAAVRAFLSVDPIGGETEEFRAVLCACAPGENGSNVRAPAEALRALGVASGANVGFTPVESLGVDSKRRRASGAKR